MGLRSQRRDPCQSQYPDPGSKGYCLQARVYQSWLGNYLASICELHITRSPLLERTLLRLSDLVAQSALSVDHIQ